MYFPLLKQSIVATVFLLPALVAANTTFTYQGQLQDDGGPFDGAVEMDFRLYNDETGGGAIDVRTEVVDVSGGLFQVELDFGDQSYETGLWLQVSVAGEELSPRQRITAAPLAVRALSSDVETFWSETSNGNISYTGGRVTVGSGLLSRFGVNAASDETAMLVFSGGQAAFRVNENRSVSVGTNYTAAGIPDQGLRVAGATMLDDTLSVGGATTLEQGLHVDGNASVGGFDDDYRLGVGTDNPWTTLHVVSNEGGGPFRVMVGNNDPSSTAIRAYSHAGVAIGNSWNDSGIPERGLRVFDRIESGGTIHSGDRLIAEGVVEVKTLSTITEDDLCIRSASGILGQCSSSERYKENITDLESPMSIIRGLWPKRYNWIESGHLDIGLIAEEVADSIPELVRYNDDGDIEGFQYSRLGAILVGAVQELDTHYTAQLTELQSENSELRDQVASLRAELDQQQRDTAERLAALEALLLDGAGVAVSR